MPEVMRAMTNEVPEPLAPPPGLSRPLPARRRPGRRTTMAAIGIILAALIVAGLIVFYQPFSDYLVIRNADPAMISLAQQAGMSNEGELVFLRADPHFASDSQMQSDCADNAAANNHNGFIEQGCYVPDPHDHAHGRIFIRKMPPSLYEQEIVTAAYEMLHSVYFASTNAGLVQDIEANYHTVHTGELDSQVVNFAKTEPDYRDLELFSLLGTEFAPLSPKLEGAYSPYFSTRGLVVGAYAHITTIFQNDQSQLKQIQQTIANDDSLANKAYAGSIAWAKAGNAYEDSYDYGIYKNYIAQENGAINQYNQLSQAYNTLVTAYNGTQPVTNLKSVTTQGSL